MATYRTPGVYVEEISTLPKSVAAVETAIPAFIGYTEKASRVKADDLLMKPTRISSLLEFERLYGFGPAVNLQEVEIDANNAVRSVSMQNNYYLYDSLQLFYANGGGDCYIVSISKYAADGSVSRPSYESGLTALERADEPTIIVLPDVTGLGDDMYPVQQKALAQCGKLKDRIAIFDMQEPVVAGEIDWEAGVDGFRSGIGINNLKYGAAYTPWLNAKFPKQITVTDIDDGTSSVLKRGGSSVRLSALAGTDTAVTTLINNAIGAVGDYDTIATDASDSFSSLLSGGQATLADAYSSLRGNVMSATTLAATVSAMEAFFSFLYDIGAKADPYRLANTISSAGLRDSVKGSIDAYMVDGFTKVISYDKAFVGMEASFNGGTALFESETYGTVGDWDNIFTPATVAAAVGIYDNANTDAEKIAATKNSLSKFDQAFDLIFTGANSMVSAANKNATIQEQLLIEGWPLYKSLVNSISNSASAIPPTGAVAGLMAFVDSTRGVWKAPANVSISGVVGPTWNYNNDEQGRLNIDTNAGKSVNAIRAFTGKGTLVWGARTLAGNDNEWRYVPVRRLFNMVEESVQKSTSWAVFEPNDANTWVRLKGQIENFLVNLWRDGALQGATPQDAFFVNVGLGSTMTYQDILEGYLNIEIGMAAVRPAEFIVLKFSHKVVENA